MTTDRGSITGSEAQIRADGPATLSMRSMPPQDRWHAPLCCGIIVVLPVVVITRYLDFASLPPYTHPLPFLIRMFSEFFLLPLFTLGSLGTLVVFIICGIVALMRRRFRQMLSFFTAAAIIPFVFMIGTRLTVFDPYFWYVLLHRDAFAEIAKSKSVGSSIFAVVETRDVSRGLVVSPIILVSIVYDQSDEIGLDPGSRPESWKASEGQILKNSNFGFNVTRIEHVLGHFYIVQFMQE